MLAWAPLSLMRFFLLQKKLRPLFGCLRSSTKPRGLLRSGGVWDPVPRPGGRGRAPCVRERGVLGTRSSGRLRAPSCVTSVQRKPGWEALQLVSFADEGAGPRAEVPTPCESGRRALSLRSAPLPPGQAHMVSLGAQGLSHRLRPEHHETTAQAPAPSWVALRLCSRARPGSEAHVNRREHR